MPKREPKKAAAKRKPKAAIYMTDAWVGAVTVKKRTDYLDTKQPGLILRVGVGLEPARTWFVRYRSTGHRRRLRLGAYPTLKLGQARDQAEAELRRIGKDGADPQHERRQAEAARRREEAAAKAAAAAEAAAAAAAAVTVGTLADQWLAFLPGHVTRRGRRVSARTVEQYSGTMRKYILPALGSCSPTAVSRLDVARLHAAVTRSGGPYMANRVVNVTSIYYSYLQGIEAVPIGCNPASRPPRNVETKRGEHASVRLSPEQEGRLLGALYSEMETDRIGATALLVLLDTGRRKGEVLGMQWRRLNLTAGTADLGPTKGKAAGDVCYLTPRVCEALRVLPRVVGCPFVFTGNGPGGRRSGLKSVWPRIKRAAGLEELSPELAGFRVHDLRHHRISELLAAGIAPQLVAQQVGHTSLDQLAVYSHLKVADVAVVLAKLQPVEPLPPGAVVAYERSVP